MSDFMDWWNSKGIGLYGNRESYELCFAAGRASVEKVEIKAEYTTGHCANHAVRGGCQLPNVQCGYPECDRKKIEAAPSQEPVNGLLPCPFCGGEAHIERVGDRRASTVYECGSCGCYLETCEEFNHGRIWNERHTVAPSQEPALKPCRSPYCECDQGACTHPGFYDARGEAAPSQEPDMPIDRGAWSSVANATDWIEELRGNEKLGSCCRKTDEQLSDAAAQIAELERKYLKNYGDLMERAKVIPSLVNKIAKLEEFNQDCRQALLRANEHIAKLEGK